MVALYQPGETIHIGRPRQGVRLGGGAVAYDYLLDLFTGTNGADIAVHPADTGQAWTEKSNNLDIQGNAARSVAAGDANKCIATVLSPFGTDVSVEVHFTRRASARPVGIVGRFVDTNNYWQISASGGGNGFQIREVTAGVNTLRTFANPTLTSGTEYLLRVTFVGNVITAIIGATTITYTSANHNTATLFGLYIEHDVTAGNGSSINDFLLWGGAAEPPVNPLYPFP